MHPSVIPALRQFLGHGEGAVDYMYLDNRPGERKVTTGIGYLIDPLPSCLEKHRTGLLRWKRGGHPATEREIQNEWQEVKAMQSFGCGQSGTVFCGRTALNLRLEHADIENYFRHAADDYQRQLMEGSPQKFGEFNSFPADAQMGILALAWAVGAGRILATYGEFRRACGQRDWHTAGQQSGWTTATGARRAQVRQMFDNADAIERQNADDRQHGSRPTYDIAHVYFPQRIVTFTRPERVVGRPTSAGR